MANGTFSIFLQCPKTAGSSALEGWWIFSVQGYYPGRMGASSERPSCTALVSWPLFTSKSLLSAPDLSMKCIHYTCMTCIFLCVT
jgi:hypothetical protein